MSLRRKLIRLAHENPELRSDLLPLLKQSAQRMSMGAWGGEEHYWPVTPREWQEIDYDWDAFRSVWKVTYQWIGRRPYMSLMVDVDAAPYIRSYGRKPGTWSANGMGQKMTGTWRSPDEIPRALASAAKWSEGVLRDQEKQVARLGGSNWDVHYDGYSVQADYKGQKSSPYSDAGMHVTFQEADEVISNGEGASAYIFYSAGADYQGHYGVREIEEGYSSIRDMERILSKAEKLFQKWQSE